MKITFHSYAKKYIYFHLKSLALSLAFMMRLTATRKWAILVSSPEQCKFIHATNQQLYCENTRNFALHT